MEKNNEKKQIGINLPEQIAEGKYSNLVIISHSVTEFVADFITILPGMTKGHVNSRVILTPSNAKRLLKSLEENIAKYEMSFGKIQDIDLQQQHQQGVLMNFGPAAEA